MVKCVIRGCPHKYGKDKVRFFSIPGAIKHHCAKTRDLSLRRRTEWIARINRNDFTESSVDRGTRVCSTHFVQGFPCSLFDLNHQDWAPSLNLGYEYRCQTNIAGPLCHELPSQSKNLEPVDENTSSPPKDVQMSGCWVESSALEINEDSSQDVKDIKLKEEPFEHFLVDNSRHEDTAFGNRNCKVEPIEHVMIDNSIQEGACISDCNVDPFGLVMVEGSSQKDTRLGDCKIEIEQDMVEGVIQEDTLSDCKTEPFEHVMLEDFSQQEESLNVFEQAPPNCDITAHSVQNGLKCGNNQEHVFSTNVVCESSGVLRENEGQCVNIGVNREIAEKLSVLRKQTVKSSEGGENNEVFKQHKKAVSCIGARLCCSKLEKKIWELLDELESVKTGLSESLVEKNISLAEKNLKIKELERKIQNLEKCNKNFMQSLSPAQFCFSQENFKGDDHKVRYYTGLPSFEVLIQLFNVFSEKVKDSHAYVLSKFQQFILVLMWLNLGFEEQDLAYRFGIGQSTVSKVLQRWILPMSSSFDDFVVWPDREKCQSNMPLWFQKKLDKAVLVLIDWFEICIKSPGQTKVNKSVKYLVATSLQREILFVSKSWDSSFKIKHITEHCGLLDKLLPGDIVMASGGFGDTDKVGFSAKEVIRASSGENLELRDYAFLKQFINVDFRPQVDWGVQHKYKILGSNLSFEFLSAMSRDKFTIVDHLVRICCAMTNVWSPTSPWKRNTSTQCSRSCP